MNATKNQKTIIPPVNRKLIEEELTDKRFIRNTSKGGNKIFILNHHNAPNIMREIGRLRELTFRNAGGGTGSELDVDNSDTDDNYYYEQLIVYNPIEQEITGGYRFITGKKALNKTTGRYELSTARYFDFSEKMKKDFLPYTIELGRSWIQPEYQSAANRKKGIFSLMNLWDGLGCLEQIYPDTKYFFGKVTMYTHYDKEARDILLSFLNHYFPSRPDLCTPLQSLLSPYDNTLFYQYFNIDTPYNDGVKLLNKILKQRGESIPPLINIYMNLSETMVTFGTARNPDFGNVEETGILVTLADIYSEIRKRHTS